MSRETVPRKMGMNKAFLMKVIVQGPAGQGFSNDVKFFDSEEAVKEAIEEQKDTLSGIVNGGKIMLPTEKGPRVIMSVRDLFSLLGIQNAAVTFSSGDMHASGKIVAGRPSILLP